MRSTRERTHPRDAGSSLTAPLRAEYRPRTRVDVERTIAAQRHGRNDPTFAATGSLRSGGVVWRASRTPTGVATLALRSAADGTVHAAAWGPGAEWALDQLPALCGALDDPEGFDASRHPSVHEWHRRHPDLRIGRTDLVFDALVSAIMEQKVTGLQAFSAWRSIVTWYGERAPGPTPHPMFAPPDLEGWRRVPSWSWHRAGLEPPQSRTIVEAARRGASIVQAATGAADAEARDRVFISLRGVGVWTSAETRIRAFGDPDAVSIGDYHLAHQVGYALTGHRTDDDGMLELLEPFAGHRQRVIRLIYAGASLEPRRGPRMHPEDHRDR